jgi:hypothetical protein
VADRYRSLRSGHAAPELSSFGPYAAHPRRSIAGFNDIRFVACTVSETIQHPRITMTEIAAMRTFGHQLIRSDPAAACLDRNERSRLAAVVLCVSR